MRDRLLEEAEEKKPKKQTAPRTFQEHMSSMDNIFLQDEKSDVIDDKFLESQPIADHFPETSILFAGTSVKVYVFAAGARP